jgi:hypothetical protein
MGSLSLQILLHPSQHNPPILLGMHALFVAGIVILGQGGPPVRQVAKHSQTLFIDELYSSMRDFSKLDRYEKTTVN